MNNSAERVIRMLSPEINIKCDEIKQVRKEKMMSWFFVLLCVMVIIIPTMFVFLGFSLISIMVPVIMIAVTFLFLALILINQQGGRSYEHA